MTPRYRQTELKTMLSGDSMDRREPLLQLQQISKHFGAVQALADVDFEVHAGEVMGLAGDNGAGKSTLVKIIAGVYHADAGEYRFDGREVSVSSPREATSLGIETVYQDLALCDNLDVVANLFLGRERVRPVVPGLVKTIDEIGMEQAALRAPLRRQSIVWRRRHPARRHRRRGHRRNQPLRRARARLVGAARRPGDRRDRQRHGSAGALVVDQVYGDRRGAARRRHG